MSASHCVYKLHTSKLLASSSGRCEQKKATIVYLCCIRLPPTWWNIFSVLIFTPQPQVWSIFKHIFKKKEKKKRSLFPAQIGRGFDKRHETRPPFSKQLRTVGMSFSKKKSWAFSVCLYKWTDSESTELLMSDFAVHTERNICGLITRDLAGHDPFVMFFSQLEIRENIGGPQLRNNLDYNPSKHCNSTFNQQGAVVNIITTYTE